MKFRIIKKTEKNIFNGSTMESFIIQRLFLWMFWINCKDGEYQHQYQYLSSAQKALQRLENEEGWKVVSKEVVE